MQDGRPMFNSICGNEMNNRLIVIEFIFNYLVTNLSVFDSEIENQIDNQLMGIQFGNG